jgi:hypothetical protein
VPGRKQAKAPASSSGQPKPGQGEAKPAAAAPTPQKAKPSSSFGKSKDKDAKDAKDPQASGSKPKGKDPSRDAMVSGSAGGSGKHRPTGGGAGAAPAGGSSCPFAALSAAVESRNVEGAAAPEVGSLSSTTGTNKHPAAASAGGNVTRQGSFKGTNKDFSASVSAVPPTPGLRGGESSLCGGEFSLCGGEFSAYAAGEFSGRAAMRRTNAVRVRAVADMVQNGVVRGGPCPRRGRLRKRGMRTGNEGRVRGNVCGNEGRGHRCFGCGRWCDAAGWQDTRDA